MFELHVTRNTLTDGAAEVTWCADRQALKRLEGQSGEPWLLLVTVPKDQVGVASYETRKLVPFTDGTARIGFRRPGSHRVFATVLLGRKSRLVDTYLRRSNGTYHTNVLSHDTKNVHRDLPYRTSMRSILKVEVPKGAFAPEPSGWTATWVGWMEWSRPSDECNFWHRFVFGITVQPFLFLAYVAARWIVATVMMVLLGSRNMHYGRTYFRPLKYGFDACMRSEVGLDTQRLNSVFWNARAPWWRQFLPLAFMPLIVAAGTGLMWLLLVEGYKLPLRVPGMVVAGVLASVSVMLALTVAIGLCRLVFDRLPTFVTRYVAKRKEAPTTDRVQFDEDAIAALTCSDASERSVRLPIARRVVLRYEEIKARRCRPFAS